MPTALESLITAVGSVFTFLIGQFSGIFEVIVEQPVLLVIFGIFITGAVIGLVMRLKNAA